MRPPGPDHTASERTTAAAREALGETAFAAAWSEGHAMPLEQVIAGAVETEQT